MRRITLAGLAAVALLALPARLHAQPERYELGRRLGLFERGWDKQTDAAARARALAVVEKVTMQFFSGQLGQAGSTLDEARWALLGDKGPSPAVAWAEALYVVPATRLVATSEAELPVVLKAFYDSKANMPKQAKLRLGFGGGPGAKPTPAIEVAIAELPQAIQVPLKEIKEGDQHLHIEIVVDGQVAAQSWVGLSAVKDLTSRLKGLKATVAGLNKKDTGLEQETLRELVPLLEALAAKTTKETDYPAARLLAEAEQVAEAIKAGKPYYGGERAGQYWLRVPAGKSAASVRILVPENAKTDKALPLVIAMHGAGGSENLFFEGYGAGYIVELCKQRGWLLVAPRSGGPATSDLVDSLAKRYPVDKSKVFVVGHSMGAAGAVSAVMQTPDRFAAVAALGGGGAVKAKADIKKLPFFVGVGSKDFARLTAKNLGDSLKKAGAPVEFREYPGVEHLVIVREALPDVFALFDKVAKGKS